MIRLLLIVVITAHSYAYGYSTAATVHSELNKALTEFHLLSGFFPTGFCEDIEVEVHVSIIVG